MEILWTALGSLTGGGALVWAIFSFVIDKRDKDRDEEKRLFYKNFYDFESRVTGEIKDLKAKVETLMEIKTAVAVHNERIANMTAKFMDYSIEVRNIISKHDEQLKEFGRIIRLGK